MDLGLAGAAVVVQGGTQGMGRAAARCFAEDGARVAVLARRQELLDETVAELLAAGAPEAFPLQADVTDRDQIEGAFALVDERWGELNVLVNATGSGGMGSFETLDRRGVVRSDQPQHDGHDSMCARRDPAAAARRMGPLVNVSAHSTKRQSAAPSRVHGGQGRRHERHQEPVAVARGRRDPGEHGVAWQLRDRDPEDVGGVRRHRHRRPLRHHGRHQGAFRPPGPPPRAGDPDEIGAVIAFVGSRRNTYMTGANINVDGGSDFC